MMHKIYLPIDTKSLYYNILNDNEKGHTCTVATPIRQGKSINKDLEYVYKIPTQIDFEEYPELIKELTKNSKSIIKINNVFVFDNLKVNGQPISIESKYCFYTKEEIDSSRVQFGRIKLHYPLSLKYENLSIDNRKVINAISDMYHGYAFIVEGFEFDFADNSLDFKVLLVGYTNIPYSKVFINNKGVGSKYTKIIKNYFDIYDSEIISLRKKYGNDVSTENFDEYIDRGKKISKDVAYEYLKEQTKAGNYIDNIRDVSADYPYSLFDFQYYLNGKIRYAIVLGTYSNVKYFNLNSFQNQFLNLFDNVTIFLITDLDKENTINIIDRNELENYCVQMNVVRFINN